MTTASPESSGGCMKTWAKALETESRSLRGRGQLHVQAPARAPDEVISEPPVRHEAVAWHQNPHAPAEMIAKVTPERPASAEHPLVRRPVEQQEQAGGLDRTCREYVLVGLHVQRAPIEAAGDEAHQTPAFPVQVEVAYGAPEPDGRAWGTP